MISEASRICAATVATAPLSASTRALARTMAAAPVSTAPRLRVTAACIAAISSRRPFTRARISSVALAVWADRVFTSAATTAKPRPASPARAASMVAFSASRLVCAEIAAMVPAISSMRRAAVEKLSSRLPISSVPSSIPRMPSVARWRSPTQVTMPARAVSAVSAAEAERAAISLVVAASSSLAAAISRACSAVPEASLVIQPIETPGIRGRSRQARQQGQPRRDRRPDRSRAAGPRPPTRRWPPGQERLPRQSGSAPSRAWRLRRKLNMRVFSEE